jgi:hypothetical protein
LHETSGLGLARFGDSEPSSSKKDGPLVTIAEDCGNKSLDTNLEGIDPLAEAGDDVAEDDLNRLTMERLRSYRIRRRSRGH